MSQTATDDTRILSDIQRGDWVSAGHVGDLAQIAQALYGQEINIRIESFWDGGWTVYIGDEMNGYRAEHSFDNDDFEQIGAWLYAEANRLYPALLGSGL